MTDNRIRLIKKYKNRRLYDMTLSQYITLEELRAYVLQGLEFKIIDASQEKDITTETLLQLFIESEEHATHFLSPEILRQLIVWSQHPMNQYYKTMLERAFLSMQHNPFFNDVQDKTTALWAKQSEQLLTSWQDLLRKWHDA